MLKVLNLYAGIGGNRKLWEDVDVTAIEANPKIAAVYQDFFPKDKVVVGDAHQYLLDYFKEFDFIWSSPRKAIIREAQIPEFLKLHDLKDFKLKNKRQVLRNCVFPKIGLHILSESKRDIQPELFR